MKKTLKRVMKLAGILGISAIMMITAYAKPSGVDVVKWLPGEHTAADFADAGTVLEAPYEFEVEANGKYTVYARDLAGNETVEIVEVNTIDDQGPAVTLTAPSTPTNQDVTVTVETSDDLSGIASVKWLEGEKTVDDFTTAGNDLTAPYAFTVPDDGTYTVYAVDTAGNATVETVTIDCIDKDAPAITTDVPTGYASSVTIGITVTD